MDEPFEEANVVHYVLRTGFVPGSFVDHEWIESAISQHEEKIGHANGPRAWTLSAWCNGACCGFAPARLKKILELELNRNTQEVESEQGDGRMDGKRECSTVILW